jgi:arabinan endo-1,5-alpha-L-arabinosidase
MRCWLALAGGLVMPAWCAAEERKPAEPAGGEIPAAYAARELMLHDPSTIRRVGRDYWLFSTGRGLRVHRSRDLERWEPVPPVFERLPDWCDEVNAGHEGRMWAPDSIPIRGGLRVYGSVSSFGNQNSAIGSVRGRFDARGGTWQWQDEGPVIRSRPGDPYNAIDPALLAAEGRLWMAFGSFWRGIFLIELDPESGRRRQPEQEPVHLAFHPEIEAPHLERRGEYYYLFVNWGKCCRGVDSTYEIRVGRSRAPEGPYVDRDGTDLRRGGGTLVLEGRPPFIGPGHASVVRDPRGRERLVCHFYDGTRRGASRLAMPLLRWTADGWPEGELEAARP